MRSIWKFTIVVASLVVLTGCDGTPFSPGPVVPTRPPIPPAPPAAATLAIEQLSLLPLRDSRSGYDVRFQLRETGGISGATLVDVLVGDLSGGGDYSGPDCWGEALRVPPGGTLDTFYSDDGRNWLGYCAVGAWHQQESVRVVVRFEDDDGRPGSVAATVTGGQ
jgi:hypothetical protein